MNNLHERKTWQKGKGTSNKTYEESTNNTDKSQNTVWSKDAYKKSLLLNQYEIPTNKCRWLAFEINPL